MSSDVGVYRFLWDCKRMGELEGIFLSTPDKVDELIGQEVDFGDILGGHDVYGVIGRGNITLVSNDPEVVRVVREYNLDVGVCPHDYFRAF